MRKPHLRVIPGFPGYFADSTGCLWSLRPQRRKVAVWRPVRLQVDQHGYLSCTLWCEPERKKRRVRAHTTVARAFLGIRTDGLVVCHVNGDRLDNRAENLRYATQRENVADKWLHGTMLSGSRSAFSKYPDETYVRASALLRAGSSARSVAAETGLSIATVKAWRAGKVRRDLFARIH